MGNAATRAVQKLIRAPKCPQSGLKGGRHAHAVRVEPIWLGTTDQMHHRWFILPTPDPYSLRLTVLSHGWVNLDPYEWDDNRCTLTRVEWLDSAQARIVLRIRQRSAGGLRTSLTSDRRLTSDDMLLMRGRLTRALGLDQDTRGVLQLARRIDPKASAILANGGGRFLRGTTLFEDAAKTLFTTNASWQSTQRMTANALKLSPSGDTFPSPADVAAVAEQDVRTTVRCGYRTAYLLRMARRFLATSDEAGLLEGGLPGLGQYGMRHLRMLQGDYSVIPVDSEVRAFCGKEFGAATDDDVQCIFASWGKYRFLGYKLSRMARRSNWIGDSAGSTGTG